MLELVHARAHSHGTVAGILLTGGMSCRMGFDKASMLVTGVPCAGRTAAMLQAAVSPAIEVGPGKSGLPAVLEDEPGSGPLVAVCAGTEALRKAGHGGGALVVACDLPLLTEAVVDMLVRWPGEGSVVPVVEGQPQPLCARWSARDLAAGTELIRAGKRAMRALLDQPGVVFADETTWPHAVERKAFWDVDAPADLDRLGLAWSAAGHDTGAGTGSRLQSGPSLL